MAFSVIAAVALAMLPYFVALAVYAALLSGTGDKFVGIPFSIYTGAIAYCASLSTLMRFVEEPAVGPTAQGNRQFAAELAIAAGVAFLCSTYVFLRPADRTVDFSCDLLAALVAGSAQFSMMFFLLLLARRKRLSPWYPIEKSLAKATTAIILIGAPAALLSTISASCSSVLIGFLLSFSLLIAFWFPAQQHRR